MQIHGQISFLYKEIQREYALYAETEAVIALWRSNSGNIERGT
jgi:hypothetical protein